MPPANGRADRYNAATEDKPSYDGSNTMNGKIAAVLLSGLLFACVQAPPPEAVAPSPPAPAAATPPALTQAIREERIVDIRSAGCEPVLSLEYEDRIAVAMFYIGYETARFESRTINVGKIPTIAKLALAYCQAHPDRPVAEAFQQAYRYGRQ